MQYPNYTTRLTGREKRLAQLQQLQQSDIQQQQADQQQQAAMMAQVNQLYNLQQAQQMDPVRLQAAELANQQSQYGLERGKQFDPVQLQALQGGVEAQRYANETAPRNFDMQQRTGQSNLDSAAQNRVLAGNQDSRVAAQHPLLLEAQQLANTHQGVTNEYQPQQLEQTMNLGNVQLRGGQLANDASALRNQALPEQLNVAQQIAQLEAAQKSFQVQYLPTQLEQSVRLGESNIAGQDVQNQIQQGLFAAQPETIRLAQEAAQANTAGQFGENQLLQKQLGVFDSTQKMQENLNLLKLREFMNTERPIPREGQRTLYGDSVLGQIMDDESKTIAQKQIQDFLVTHPTGGGLPPEVRARAEQLFPGQVDTLWPTPGKNGVKYPDYFDFHYPQDKKRREQKRKETN